MLDMEHEWFTFIIFILFYFQTGSSSEVRALHGMSEESLSDGCFDSGHKKIP